MRLFPSVTDSIDSAVRQATITMQFRNFYGTKILGKSELSEAHINCWFIKTEAFGNVIFVWNSKLSTD